MRVSAITQQRQKLKMMSSTNYKKYYKTNGKNDSTTPSKNDKTTTDASQIKDQSIKLGDSLQIEKKGTQLTISQVGKDNKLTKIQDLSTTSDQGQILLRLFKPETSPSIVEYKKQLLESKRNASITKYI